MLAAGLLPAGHATWLAQHAVQEPDSAVFLCLYLLELGLHLLYWLVDWGWRAITAHVLLQKAPGLGMLLLPLVFADLPWHVRCPLIGIVMAGLDMYFAEEQGRWEEEQWEEEHWEEEPWEEPWWEEEQQQEEQ